MKVYWKLVRRPGVLGGSLKVALFVGTLLILINDGDRIFAGQLVPGDFLKMLLTVLVPFCVSLYSRVAMLGTMQISRPPEALDSAERGGGGRRG